MQNNHVSQYVSEKTIAKLFDVSIKKLQKDRALKRGLPYIKFGRSVRYNIDEVTLYMQTFAQQVTPAGIHYHGN